MDDWQIKLKQAALDESPLSYEENLYTYPLTDATLYHAISAKNKRAVFYKCRNWAWIEHVVIAQTPPFYLRACKRCEKNTVRS